MLTQEKGAHRTCWEQFLPQRLDEFYSPIINMTNPLENPTKPWPRRSHTAHCMRRSPQGLFVWRENLPAKYYLCTWNLPSHLYTHINDNLRPCCLLGLVDGSCQVLRCIDTLWRLNHQRWFYQVVWLGPRRICWETRMIDGQSIYSGSQILASIKIIWESDTDGKSVGRTKRQLTASTKSASCQTATPLLYFPTHLPSNTPLGIIVQLC
jgi:hypothetical protein